MKKIENLKFLLWVLRATGDVKATVMYAGLVALRPRKKLGDGWFPVDILAIQEITGLSYFEQWGAVKKLKTAGIIEEETRGMPPRRFFFLRNNQQNKY